MESDKPDILTRDAWEKCRVEGPGGVVASHAKRVRSSDHGTRDYLNYMVYVMMQDYYFGNLMLGKLDLLAAHVGIEARCPYTDPAYAHFVFNVPAQFKTRDGMVKYFFKKAIEGLLPNEIIYRPKQGFRTPVVELFRGALGDWAEPVLLESGLTKTGFLRSDHLAKMLKTHRNRERDCSNRLWTAMVLNLWYDRWIKAPSRPTHSAVQAVGGGAGSYRPVTVNAS
jgi:asparagine synthase (glutamine-hydrolysing)